MDLLPFQSKRKITFKSGIAHIARDIISEERFYKYQEFFSTPLVEEADITSGEKYIYTAVFLELYKFYKKTFPKLGIFTKESAENHLNTMSSGAPLLYKTVIIDPHKKTLYTTKFRDTFANEDLLFDLAISLGKLTSPPLFANATKDEFSLSLLDSLLILLTQISYSKDEGTQTVSTKSLIELLPPAYRKMVEKILKSEKTLILLTEFLASKKKSKKYMRILQKRFGVYHMKKPPFTK